MARFRYDTSGRWFKGNTHIHSTASDGGKTFAEIAAMYAAAGYDFLFRTDHWVASDAAADPAAYPLLWLDGCELDGNSDDGGATRHVVCLGQVRDLPRERGLDACAAAARAQGALLVLAHPHWSGNTPSEAVAGGYDAVEVYNDVCRWMNGKGDGSVFWSAMLARNPNTLGFAADDAHLRTEHPGWNGGWIMVNAPDLSRAALLDAIRRGNFYSSCGPRIESIRFDGRAVTVHTSPARVIRLVGPAWNWSRAGTLDGPLITEATLELPRDWPYVTLEVEDEVGRRAWTNPLLCAKE